MKPYIHMHRIQHLVQHLGLYNWSSNDPLPGSFNRSEKIQSNSVIIASMFNGKNDKWIHKR